MSTWTLRLLATLFFVLTLIAASFVFAGCGGDPTQDFAGNPPMRGARNVQPSDSVNQDTQHDAHPDATPSGSADMGSTDMARSSGTDGAGGATERPGDGSIGSVRCPASVIELEHCPTVNHSRCELDSRYIYGCQLVNSNTLCVERC